MSPNADSGAKTSTHSKIVTDWRWQLGQVFAELDRRRTVAALSRPIEAERYAAFIQSVVIPAFRKFCDALKEAGDVPEFHYGEDWVGIRWQEGNVINFNSKNRAPNRAATAVDRTRALRAKYGEPDISELTQMTEQDVLRWLVLSYAAIHRVSESELAIPHPGSLG